jgi:hypothetical protein
VRRVPFWLHVTRAGLSTAPTTPIGAPGLHAGDTSGKPSLASRYRYPDVPSGGSVTATLQGPEQLFRLDLTRPVANFGVVILHRDAGVQVEPRVVEGADENRLTGYPALPLYLNPYTPQLYDPVLAAGAVRPLPGEYEVVFDSPTPAGAGRFTFRYWIDDTTPPTVRLDQLRVRRGLPLVARVSDGGSGVDPGTLEVRVDGKRRTATLRAGVVRIPTTGLAAGRHLLRIQISDYQESRNMENVPPILPNTRALSVRVAIR